MKNKRKKSLVGYMTEIFSPEACMAITEYIIVYKNIPDDKQVWKKVRMTIEEI